MNRRNNTSALSFSTKRSDFWYSMLRFSNSVRRDLANSRCSSSSASKSLICFCLIIYLLNENKIESGLDPK